MFMVNRTAGFFYQRYPLEEETESTVLVDCCRVYVNMPQFVQNCKKKP